MALGPAGRLAALALLMLQLTSSGGTYPVQTSPGFFQAIHPWLPMTYVVDGLRHTSTAVRPPRWSPPRWCCSRSAGRDGAHRRCGPPVPPADPVEAAPRTDHVRMSR
ncbi:hypothetical protein V2I01_22965 [Micromonospora sp. BRA006-A]|nr:hypothetical protein [Micromonospora sp. BRA006-A]